MPTPDRISPLTRMATDGVVNRRLTKPRLLGIIGSRVIANGQRELASRMFRSGFPTSSAAEQTLVTPQQETNTNLAGEDGQVGGQSDERGHEDARADPGADSARVDG
jgi:hypothetical protein